MAENHVISALISKHSEIQGKIKECRNQLSILEQELVAINKSIKIFNDDYDIRSIAPKSTNKRLFKRGELSKTIIQNVKAKDKVSSSDILNIIFDNPSDIKRYKSSVFATLNNIVKKGYLELYKDNGLNYYSFKND